MYRVGIVCEGDTDSIVIEAVLDTMLDDYKLLSIQPPGGRVGGDSGPLGGGWKGVQRWCMQEARIEWLSDLRSRADLLIIQVDADVAREVEINRDKPCPPPTNTADEVRALILEWLNLDALPSGVVLCVPAMASETWALVALFPQDSAVVPCDPPSTDGQCVECRTDVKAILRRAGRRLRPKLVVGQGGELKNQAQGYRKVQARISGGWQTVVSTCSEARRFGAELQTAIS